MDNATNVCCFLSLKIIDNLIDLPFNQLSMQKIISEVEEIIQLFRREINKYRNTSALYDIYKVSQFLDKHQYLNNQFIFEEKLWLNKTLYSYDFQQGFVKELNSDPVTFFI